MWAVTRVNRAEYDITVHRGKSERYSSAMFRINISYRQRAAQESASGRRSLPSWREVEGYEVFAHYGDQSAVRTTCARFVNAELPRAAEATPIIVTEAARGNWHDIGPSLCDRSADTLQ